MYITRLACVWVQDSTAETTGASVGKKINSFVDQGLDHATEMLSALWELANVDSDIKTAVNASSPVSWFHFCVLPCSMQECSPHATRPYRSRVPHTGHL